MAMDDDLVTDMLREALIPQWIRDDPYEPRVLSTIAGYYVGTCMPDYAPYARYTGYMGKEEAEALLESGDWVYQARPTP